MATILSSMNLNQGEYDIIKNIGQKYSLKIVVSVKKDTITVITNYPLKKGRKK